MVVCVCTPTCTCSYHSTLSCTLARCVLSSYFLCVSGFFPFILIVLTAYTHQHMHIAPHVYIPHLTAPLHTLFLPQHPPSHVYTSHLTTHSHHTSPHTLLHLYTPHHTPTCRQGCHRLESMDLSYCTKVCRCVCLRVGH